MHASGFLTGLRHTASALGLGVAAAAGAIWVTGGSPVEALTALATGAAGSPEALLRSLAKATPLLLSGLAVAVALRCGLFNIGAEGQILVGGLAAAWVGGMDWDAPAWVHAPAALLAGALAGAAWGAVPGILRGWRGTHEVIVTIMMNYIAIHLTHYLVNGPLRDPTTMAVATRPVHEAARLWSLPGGTQFSAGFFLALAAAAAVAVMFGRSALGYEIRAVGQGPRAARAAGVPVALTMVRAMCISGALAGLAGAVEVLGVHRRFFDAFSPGYGFDSIAVALLGGLSAWGVTLSSVLFGGLAAGSVYMEGWTATPRQVAGVVQAVVIVAAGSRLLRQRRRDEE